MQTKKLFVKQSSSNTVAVGEHHRDESVLSCFGDFLSQLFLRKERGAVPLLAGVGRRQVQAGPFVCLHALAGTNKGKFNQCFGSGFNQVHGSGFGIRIQEGKNDTQK
jgi:hypothetical protein